MNNNKIVNPSDLLQSTLPDWIRSPENILNEGITTTLDGTQLRRETYKSQNHKNFVNFMEKSAESNERSGYSQDLLQNLLKYRDFDTYKNEIVKYNYLDEDIDEVNEDELLLVDSYGFPDNNGIILVNGEVILYRRKEGNKLVELQRGCSATKVLPTFRDTGEYIQSVPDEHNKGSRVDNLSVLHLVALLDIIHKTYAVNIDSDRVVPEVNRSSLLQNISDFFRSKGSKLGIKSLFKFLFNTTDVDVFYPGDRMIKPSESTWTESLIMRTVPLPKVFCDPDEVYTTPEDATGSKVIFKSYLSEEDIYAETYCEYVSVYQYKSETQYELVLNKHDFIGEIINNPSSPLTRSVSGILSSDGRRDYDTVTVQSTFGFPDQGVIFIDQEAIYYNRKTPNQFLGCQRGHIGVEAPHSEGSIVYGPYYVETRLIDKNGVERVSRSWPKGIVEAVDVIDPGLLNDRYDRVDLGINGMFDPREQILCTIKKESNYNTLAIGNNQIMTDERSLLRLSGYEPFVVFEPSELNETLEITFLENYEDDLVLQDPAAIVDGYLRYVGNRTHGVDSIYFDDDYVFVSSSGFPSYSFGDFNKTTVCPVGRQLEDENVFAVIPRRNNIKENIVEDNKYIIEYKGTDSIGIFIDGVRAYSNVSPEHIVQGSVGTFDIIERGFGYKNPTVLLDGFAGIAEPKVVNGHIVDIKLTSVKNYTENPSVEITSGKGASLQPSFDRYGRITSIKVLNGGFYYNDQPIVQAVDATGKGKGSLLKANILNGYIFSVDIISQGIDYDEKATTIEIKPVGEGAVAQAVTQYYEVNRPVEIENKKCEGSDDNWKFDQGNGFLYERPGYVGPISNLSKTTFAYTQDPVLLTEVEEGTHSPLVGWAFDGNPIYGPYGFSNNVDETKGVERQQSAYRLRQSRNNIIPARSKVIGTDPPLVSEYPMGYFVQDFVYDPFYTPGDDTDDIGFLNTETPVYINTEDEKYIELEFRNTPPEDIPNNLLDINNGKICNTPEFPKALYPDGVYCYFITVDENHTPQFPYIIGKTFNNRPISQNINQTTKRTIDPLPRQSVYSSLMYDDTSLEFDLSKVERLRNLYDRVNEQEIKLEIGKTSEGYLNDVIIQDGQTPDRIVGDYLYFDNTGTSGGGASATVSRIEGKQVILGEAKESNVEVISHHFVIDLSNNYDEYLEQVKTFTLNKDYVTECFDDEDYAIIKVLEYDHEGALLFVEAVSPTLPKEGFKMFDQRREPIIFGEVLVMPVPAEHDILWVTSDKDIEPGQILVLDNGVGEDYIRDELIKVDAVMGNGAIRVIRDFETNTNQDIDDGTMLVVNNKFVYEITTSTPHMLFGGDVVYFYNDDQFDPNQPYEVNLTLSNNIFYVYTDELKQNSSSVKYTTSSANATGYVAGVHLDSAGYGYSSLPKIKGIYNAFIDRAIVYPNLSGGQITSYTIDDGGFRYSDVEVYIVDVDNLGSGASATAVIEDGTIVDVIADETGDNYVQPIVYILQKGGKYIPTTDNIGKIESIKVINPGRDLGVEGNNRPEVITPTRVVVKYIEGDEFESGQDVYQGCNNLLTATAVVEYYDSERQLLVLKNVTGFIRDDEFLYNIYGTKAEVLLEGDSHCMLKVNGTSTPQGYFVDDTSVISSDYAVIQDSYRYQWFSYVIASNIQKVEYDTFVETIIHPAGFIRFGDLTLRTSIQSTFTIPNSRDGNGNEDLGAKPLPPLDPCIENDTILIVGDTTDMPILVTDNGEDMWLNISTANCEVAGDYCDPRWLQEGSEISNLITASSPDGDKDIIVDHCGPEINN